METIMRKIITAALVGAAAIGGTAACSHPVQKITCGVSVYKWYKHQGGKADIAAVRSQAAAALKAGKAVEQGKADPASIAAAKKASASLSSSITALKGNLPPDCAGGVNGDVAAGLGDYVQVSKHLSKAATDSQHEDAKALQAELGKVRDFARAGDDEFGKAGRGVLAYLRS